jgi:hypothetical protein
MSHFALLSRVLGAGCLLAVATGCGSSADDPAVSIAADSLASADLALSDDAAYDAEQDLAPADVVDQAKVYLSDPISDNGKTTLVTFAHPTDENGYLAGDFASVANCLQEDGGAAMKQQGMVVGNLCLETRTAMRDPDGSYLSIKPPADDSDPADKFAELMMYYHVNQIHDYYQDGFDLALKHNPIDALVNVTFNSKFDMGSGAGWQGFPNAAFIPPEGFAAFGLPKKPYGAIVFGQYESTDFSYDASVIYHEYTHAMMGTTRLNGVLVDYTGLDNLPGAMGEGFADYFSCSRRDSPIVGPYALAAQGDSLVRDLTHAHKCPDDLTTEIHADGKIVGSTMWEIRTAIGQQQADTIILAAVQSFTASTNLTSAGKLILSEAKKVDAETGKIVGDILKAHGMITCVRAKEWTDFSAMTSEDHVPISVEGTDALQPGSGLTDGVPGYFQLFVDVPAGTAGVKLSWRASPGQGAGMGGSGSAPNIQLALKKGAPVQLAEPLAPDAMVQGKTDTGLGKSWQSVTLSANCLPTTAGKVYLMLLNTGGAADIGQTKISMLSDTSKAINVVTCVK